MAVWLLAALAAALKLPVSIRDVSTQDVMPVAKLLRSTFAADANSVSGLLIVAENALGLRERMRDNVMLVATPELPLDGVDREGSSNLVGFVELLTPAWLASDQALAYPDRVREQQQPYIFSLAVEESSRSRGVATALMRAAEARAAEQGHSILTLEVEETNAAALALYARLGYELVDRDEGGRMLVGDIFFGQSKRVVKLSFQKRLSFGGELTHSTTVDYSEPPCSVTKD